MPPSPELTATLNPAIWDRACTDLGMGEDDRPQVKFIGTKGRDSNRLGTYFSFPIDSIEIYTDWDEYENGRLTAASNDLARVLLHELRHAWQHRTWPKHDLDDVVKKENDAREYEDIGLARYRGIIRVTRKQHGSAFSKLGAAENRVRQGV